MATTARTVLRDPFPPGRSSPCFCGSGRRFKHCCGNTDPGRDVPAGIGIVPDFLTAEECRAMVERAEECATQRLKVVDLERSTPGNMIEIDDDRRVTEWVDLGDDRRTLDRWVERSLTEVIGPKLRRSYAWYERPQLLKYTPGGFYAGHADSDHIHTPTGRWQKVLDRDTSLLIYLNDEYEGGALYFDHFDYTLRPRAGMMVHFPSDVRYMHTAQSVTAGVRYAVVSWAAFDDEPRVKSQPPQNAVGLDRQTVR
jgi:hypothetical protein